MRRFQHLTYANNFPNDDVHTFQQYLNTFDYDRWTAETKLKPCTVRWTLETNDRVKWNTDAERDKWFDQLKGETYELSSAMNRIVAGENVKLPIPWQALQFANYLEVQVPDMPDDAKPLDYSTPHVSRIYYFIVDSKYISPSVSECILVRDNWTTYINDIDIPRIEMERGHQAMTGATPAQYLADPINHLTGLTEQEPDAPADPTKVANSEFHPLGSGAMWLMMAVKCDYSRLSDLAKAGAKTDSTPAKYSDDAAEWSRDYNVTDYAWGGESDVMNLTTPLTTLSTGGGSHPTGMTTIAISATKAQEFVSMLNWTYPQLWNVLAAAWVLPRAMFEVWSNPLKLQDIEVWHVRPIFEKSLANINLNPNDFSYDEKYAKITKLYTSPYAWLSVTNGDTNETANIRIEDTTSNLKISERVNLAYPYLRSQTFLSGVGGDQTITYEWRAFDGDTQTTTIGASAWQELTTHEIPTFSLFVNSAHLWNLDNAGAMKQLARDNAIRNYHTAQRATNVAQLNAKKSAETGLANTTASANTALSNATTGADTAKSNVNASNATTQSNAALQRDYNSWLAGRQNELSSAINGSKIGQLQEDLKINNRKIGRDAGSAHDVLNASFEAKQESNVISATTSAAATITTAGIGMAATVATGGAALPLVVGATAASQVGTTAMNATITATSNEALYNASYNNISDCASWAQSANTDLEAQEELAIARNYVSQRDYNMNVTDTNNTLTQNQTNNTTATSNANAERTRNTTVSNATASKNTAIGNATASRDTSVTNTNRTRDAATFANQTALDIAQATWNAKLKDLQRSKATELATPTGDVAPDMFGVRGVQVRVMTQNDDITRRCGDDMLRHGYTWHANVENPALNVMQDFTYWQGTPQLIPVHAPAQAVNDIGDLFREGITVWRNPDRIGCSIYENLEA